MAGRLALAVFFPFFFLFSFRFHRLETSRIFPILRSGGHFAYELVIYTPTPLDLSDLSISCITGTVPVYMLIGSISLPLPPQQGEI